MNYRVRAYHLPPTKEDPAVFAALTQRMKDIVYEMKAKYGLPFTAEYIYHHWDRFSLLSASSRTTYWMQPTKERIEYVFNVQLEEIISIRDLCDPAFTLPDPEKR